ncbi:hypothetical protein KUCAC02_023775 [Chaenocephalus aceratus]|uniref:Uncharacterized protein n=1 Tax=Chaenocephalus aceratus TaxID=36190 RepID=A0ACB9WFX5_CHAAC|nr:hypothetical protein KUCAC02_023775 [Chaenocephalus aceratus]
MVKYFSVDWLAQSHEHTAVTEDAAPACRPHIPCMVQPCPPTFGKSYLQPKPRAHKPVESVESSGQDRQPVLTFPYKQVAPHQFQKTSGYSSGYESEAASSECLSVDDGSDAEKTQRSAECAPNSPPSRSTNWRKSSNQHKYLDAGERVNKRTEAQPHRKLRYELRPHFPAHRPAFYPLTVSQLVLQQQMRPPHVMIHNPHYY